MMEAVIEQDREPVATSATAAKMFKYSSYVDVGEGAAECEHARDGQCEDIEHFHAWCRLPNPYQHQDIREKGLAAKARKIREYRDRDSDASVILDEKLDLLAEPGFTDTLIDELLGADWAQDYLEATQDVSEREEFEHVDQDREEYNRLRPSEGQLDAEERSDAYKQLEAHMQSYVDAINARLREIQQPKRDELAARSNDALVALVRARRVEDEGDTAFMETYNSWMWFVGTFKVELHPTLGRPHLPMWEEIGRKDRPAAGTMFGEAPEVVAALKVTFNELQLALQKGAAGN